MPGSTDAIHSTWTCIFLQHEVHLPLLFELHNAKPIIHWHPQQWCHGLRHTFEKLVPARSDGNRSRVSGVSVQSTNEKIYRLVAMSRYTSDEACQWKSYIHLIHLCFNKFVSLLSSVIGDTPWM